MSDRPSKSPPQEEIATRLLNELGYSKHGAEAVVEELAKVRPEVQRAFEDWWFDGRLDTLEVEGWTALKISAHLGCLPPAALLNMNWLLTDPKSAGIALQRGIDRIVKEP